VLPTLHLRSRNFMQRSYILWSREVISCAWIQPPRVAMPRPHSQCRIRASVNPPSTHSVETWQEGARQEAISHPSR
jgi:hypothetical protein